jgi:hypothetical protein
MRRRMMTACAALMFCAVAGCDEKLSDLTGPTPDLQPTFSSIQQNILQTADRSGRAACTQCHAPGGTRTATILLLTPALAYAQLVNAPALGKRGAIRVIPGDPENSYLIHKLEGRPGIAGDRMPDTGPVLTDGQVQVIKRWIALGAPNN